MWRLEQFQTDNYFFGYWCTHDLKVCLNLFVTRIGSLMVHLTAELINLSAYIRMCCLDAMHQAEPLYCQ